MGAALIACGASVAGAQTLPPDAAVQAALDAHPAVQGAEARVDSARADQRALNAGPHEFTFTGSYARRTIDREGQFNEYDATLSRAFRLPGKARLDAQAGALGVEAARNNAEDARHQAARLLNDLWWEWIGASAQAAVDAQSVANYQRTLDALKRRVSLRDTAQMEADQAAAALADAQVVAAQSRGQAALARVRLAAQFPALPLPDSAPVAPEPVLADATLLTMRDQVLERSHEIAAAQAEAGRSAALAERARQDRIADPSVGLRLFSERGGAERGAGVTFSIPLGGGARRAAADRGAAQASVAQAELALVRQSLREMAEGDVARARSAYAAWVSARAALEAQMAALAKLRRGLSLNAVDLADVLQGERLTHAAFRTEADTRAQAHRAINCLRIDSHNLWIAD
ncbi:TolC family protein [Novosphingobium sp. FSY-8]|uniref:TolC family protein n=1 Tax=Novosphingobium ovatum TaxID=1908523 RepID=A0ABW9XFX8_9SPHN|nr:TolC family protein [Novosphingobium ovatum]